MDLSEADRKRDLARRLTSALLTPVVLLLGVGVLLGAQILRMSEDARWVDHSDEVIAKTYELTAQVLRQESSLRAFVATGDRAYLDGYESVHPLETIEELRTLVSDNATQVLRVDDVGRDYEQWSHDAKVAMAAGVPSTKQQVLEQIASRAHRHDELRAAVATFLDAEQALHRDRTVASADSTQATRIGFVAVFLVVAVVLSFLSRRQLGSIARTYGGALEAERGARASIEDQDWVRAGQVSVSEQLQGDVTVDELAAKVLPSLAASTGAQVGAFFRADGSGWRRSAGYGLDAKDAGQDFFGPEQGLVGRVGAEQKVLRLRDVPPDFLKVRSGTGERAPIEVLLVPAVAEQKVYAVLELGFLGPIGPRALSLVERVGTNIAIAVRSAEYRARLRELLDESQAQGEELLAQQEELRAANDTLREQGTALRDAHAQLEERQEAVVATNARLEEQTEELVRTRDAAATKAAEAERANRYKSEFLAKMSHELRTPLNSSLILARLLADNVKGNLSEEQVTFARTIHGAGNDLLGLVNDILDLSKVEAGKMEVRSGPVRIDRIVEGLTLTFEPVAREKELRFQVRVDPGAPETIETDAQRLEQILRNLASNAIKFTERGEVEVTVAAAADRVEFIVRDTGIGISPESQAIVFEAFRQADETARRRYGGTGLGLSISRDLAHLLGGEITMQSELGRGSVFTLRLPRALPVVLASTPAPAHAPVAAMLPPAPENGAHEATNGVKRADLPAIAHAILTEAEPSTRVRTRPELVTAGVASIAPPVVSSHLPSTPVEPASIGDAVDAATGGRVVLVVEDDVPFAKILVDLAHELDFKCIVAHRADDGYALARQYLPSAVLLDIKLPDHTGLSVLDRIKRDPKTRHIPVHVVSAVDHATQTALSMGAIGYVLKPVEREGLTAAFGKLEARMTRRVRRLLVADDDAEERARIVELLGGVGWEDVEVVAVDGVAAAMDAIGSSTFDCIVTDLTPAHGMSFPLLERMAQDGASFPPVVAYTSRPLAPEEQEHLRRLSRSIVINDARSVERLLDQATLFLHRVEAELPIEQQRMLRDARDREAVFEGKRILVVEDDVRNIFALSSVLEPRGAKVLVARNGREALETLESAPDVDLVLMDVMMPEMDGVEATLEIRKNAAWSRLPIIALTAKAMKDDRDRCRDAGANDFIAKPIDVDKLLSLLRVWLPR